MKLYKQAGLVLLVNLLGVSLLIVGMYSSNGLLAAVGVLIYAIAMLYTMRVNDRQQAIEEKK